MRRCSTLSASGMLSSTWRQRATTPSLYGAYVPSGWSIRPDRFVFATSGRLAGEAKVLRSFWANLAQSSMSARLLKYHVSAASFWMKRYVLELGGIDPAVKCTDPNVWVEPDINVFAAERVEKRLVTLAGTHSKCRRRSYRTVGSLSASRCLACASKRQLERSSRGASGRRRGQDRCRPQPLERALRDRCRRTFIRKRCNRREPTTSL